MFHKVRDIVRSQGVSGLARRSICSMLIGEECVRASPASLSTTRASPFAMIGSGATAWFRKLGFPMRLARTSLIMRLRS